MFFGNAYNIIFKNTQLTGLKVVEFEKGQIKPMVVFLNIAHVGL